MENNNTDHQNADYSKDVARPSSDSSEQKQVQQQQIVPVLEEDYSISKQTSIK
jgi:hypothetical protein